MNKEFTKYQKHVLHKAQGKILADETIHELGSKTDSLYFDISNSNFKDIDKTVSEMKKHIEKMGTFVSLYERLRSTTK